MNTGIQEGEPVTIVDILCTGEGADIVFVR